MDIINGSVHLHLVNLQKKLEILL